MQSKLRAQRSLSGWLVGLVAMFQFACSDSEAAVMCLDYLCVNSASMVGSVEVSDDVTSVDVEYCSEHRCTGGRIALGSPHMAACNPGEPGTFDDGVCITPSDGGELKVEAALLGPDDEKLPPDGETYTLEIIDHDSRRVLLDVAREADYVETRKDECHLCWSAEMTF